MFDDDSIKYESQLLIIDLMIHSVDDVLQFIREHIDDLNEYFERRHEMNLLLSKIFSVCKKIIESIPLFIITSNATKQQLIKTISIVQKYWDADEMNLFTINWFLFVSQWNDFVENIRLRLGNSDINHISLN